MVEGACILCGARESRSSCDRCIMEIGIAEYTKRIERVFRDFGPDVTFKEFAAARDEKRRSTLNFARLTSKQRQEINRRWMTLEERADAIAQAAGHQEYDREKIEWLIDDYGEDAAAEVIRRLCQTHPQSA